MHLLLLLCLSSAAPVQSAAPVWSFGTFGDYAGGSSIVPIEIGGRVELALTGSLVPIGSDFLQYVRWEHGNGEWQSTFLSPIFAADVNALAVGALEHPGAQTLAVLREDGVIHLFDAVTRAPLHTITTGLVDAQQLALADFDGDGRDELVVKSDDVLATFTAAGAMLASVLIDGPDVVAGQMDADPAIEVAVNYGTVFEGAGLSPQWTWPSGFGGQIALQDVDADGFLELIGKFDFVGVSAFDVDRSLPLWSWNRVGVYAIHPTDLESDGVPEVAYVTNAGDVGCLDARNGAPLWEAMTAAGAGVSLTTVDAEGDGDLEIVFTASGISPQLWMMDWQTRAILWKCAGHDGPFVGLRLGDVDGDADEELVMASHFTNRGFDAGRIAIFDAATRLLQATSPPVANNRSFTGVHDLVLHDLDGDLTAEILVATDDLLEGIIEVYDYAAGAFTLAWRHPAAGMQNSAFYSLAVGDPDLDGELEIVAGSGESTQPSPGSRVHVFDWLTGAEEWSSPNLGGAFGRIHEVAIADVDGDGAPEILAMVRGDDVKIYDGVTKALEATIFGAFESMTTVATAAGVHVLLGDGIGRLNGYLWNGASYPRVLLRTIANGPVEGVTAGPRGRVWASAEGRLRSIDVASGATVWISANYRTPFGAPFGGALTALPADPRWVFASGEAGALMFKGR